MSYNSTYFILDTGGVAGLNGHGTYVMSLDKRYVLIRGGLFGETERAVVLANWIIFYSYFIVGPKRLNLIIQFRFS